MVPVAASVSVLAGDPEIIDLSVLAEIIGDDRERIAGFMCRFIASGIMDVDEIERALQQCDMKALRSLGHRAKSPARMVGAIGFANLCQALENCDGEGSLEQARNIAGRLRPLLQQIAQEVEKL